MLFAISYHVASSNVLCMQGLHPCSVPIWSREQHPKSADLQNLPIYVTKNTDTSNTLLPDILLQFLCKVFAAEVGLYL